MARDYKIQVTILGKDKFSTAMGGVRKALGGLGGTLKTMGVAAVGGLGALTGAAGAAGAALTKLAMDAAPLQGIEAAFRNLAETSGESADKMLAALQEGSAGMVAQRDLMQSYNLATQLVGDTFANTLPEAMQYLTKVSAATGESMDYLMNSLVRGVGRASPLILDNLGIQVDLNEAYEEWAKVQGKALSTTVDNSQAIQKLTGDIGALEQEVALAEQAFHAENAELIHARNFWAEGSAELGRFETRVDRARSALEAKQGKLAEQRGELAKLQAAHGKVVSSTEDLTKSMSKEDQQAALLAHVMEKLAENTQNMPDITENAATSIAALQAKFQDAKDAIGVAFLPVVTQVLAKLSEVADQAIPYIVDAVETLADVLTGEIGWEELVPPWLMERIQEAIGLWDQVAAVLQETLPAAIAQASDAFDTLTATLPEIQTAAMGAFEGLHAWFMEKWPTVAAVVLTAWEAIKAAIGSAVDVIVGTSWPKLKAAFDTLTEVMASFGVSWSDVWDALKQAVEIVIIGIGAILLALVAVVTGVINGIATGLEVGLQGWRVFADGVKAVLDGITQLAIAWYQVISSILEGDIPAAIEGLKAVWEGLGTFWKGIFTAIAGLVVTFVGTVLGFIEGLVSGIVEWFQNMKDALVGGSIVPDMINAIVGWFAKLPGMILGVMSGLVTAVGESLKGLFGSLLEFDPRQVSDMLVLFVEIIEQLKEAWMLFAAYLVEESWPLIQEAWTALMLLMQKYFQDLVMAVLFGCQEMVRAIDLVTLAFNRMGSAIRAVEAAIRVMIKALMEMVSDEVLGKIEKLIEKMESLADAYNKARKALEALHEEQGKAGGSPPEEPPAGAAPGLQGGLWRVSREMLARLHPGEMVLPEGVAAAFRGTVAGVTGATRPAAAGGMVILAPVFLDSREFVSAAGEIDYEAVGRRLRELQGGL